MAGFEVIIYGRFWVIAEAPYIGTVCVPVRPAYLHHTRHGVYTIDLKK